MGPLPIRPDLLTVDWLSQRLDAAGMLTVGKLVDFSWQPIGTGQVGDSARITLTYDRPGAGPPTVVGKFPAADLASRQTAAALRLYAKEVRFYQEIAPRLSARVPQVMAAEIADDGVDFILLLEDMGPARIGNQLNGCTLADARAAIRQAAAIHAPSWNDPVLAAIPWLQPPGTNRSRRVGPDDQSAAAHAIFRERYAGILEPELMAVCDAFNEVSGLWHGHRDGPKCIVHGDFRLDNLLFDIRGGAEPVAVLDWQTVTFGMGANDIGYFLGTGIGDALRSLHEDELLNLYCTEMSARGVPLTRDMIWDDYIVGALLGISTAVFSAAFVERTPRGDANFLSMARGACALALQHGSIAKLKERE